LAFLETIGIKIHNRPQSMVQTLWQPVVSKQIIMGRFAVNGYFISVIDVSTVMP